MKFIKKAAALFFCAALALSVMAVGALADDEAELLTPESGVATTANNDFQVKLSQTTRDTTFNVGIYDRDDVTGSEINASDKVTFDITLFYTGSDYTASSEPAREQINIDAFQFDFTASENAGATIDSAVILTTPSATAADMGITGTGTQTCLYSAGGNKSADISLPGNNGALIGRITVEFTKVARNAKIYPTIKNLLIHMRDNDETMQQPVAWVASESGGETSAPAGNNSGNGIIPGTGSGTNVAPNTNVVASGTNGCVVVATQPVYVNPVYAVKLKTFKADDGTGIIALDKTPGADKTLYYDFTNGSFVGDNGDINDVGDYKYTSAGTSYDTILKNPSFPGYTFKGWMVTTVGISGAAPDSDRVTWAAYSGSWDKETSYPATHDNGDTLANTSVKVWGADGWYDKNNTTTDTRKDNTESSANFIPVDESGLTDTNSDVYTKFPAGKVGPITLTPVFTRNVYTATFKAQPEDLVVMKATFTGAAFAPTNGGYSSLTSATNGTGGATGTAATYTQNYTIEDLYNATNAATEGYTSENFLGLDYNKDSMFPGGPRGLTRTAYKFMGWTVSAETDDVTNEDVADGYSWENDYSVSSVDNTTNIIVTSRYKHYGDVTFTAFWEEDVYFAKIAYQYAGGSNALILVGVPNDTGRNNYNANYTYKFEKPESESATAVINKMFIVPALLDGDGKATTTTSGSTPCAQRTAYVDAATKVNNNPDNDVVGSTTMVSDFVDNTVKGYFGENKTYVLFAYIAPTSSADVTDVKIEETDSRQNESLNYDGNVDNSTSGINVGDIGNVDTLLNDARDTENVFKITNGDGGMNGYYGVRARLQSDVYGAAADEGKTMFANIRDVRDIYFKMGGSAT